jgi:hypothetical protein
MDPNPQHRSAIINFFGKMLTHLPVLHPLFCYEMPKKKIGSEPELLNSFFLVSGHQTKHTGSLVGIERGTVVADPQRLLSGSATLDMAWGA